MRVPWFLKGFSRPFAFQLEEPVSDDKELQKSEPANPRSKPSLPKFFNAFEIILSMSSGFDLSGLFESKMKIGSMFTSKCSVTTIISKIKTVARRLSFKVGNEKGFKMRLQGSSEGRKGRLTVTMEVFEVTSKVAVMEFSKSSGDTLEYAKFCKEEVRPALKMVEFGRPEATNFGFIISCFFQKSPLIFDAIPNTKKQLIFSHWAITLGYWASMVFGRHAKQAHRLI